MLHRIQIYYAASDLTDTSWIFTVLKATPAYTAPTGFLAVVGSTLGDIDLTTYNINGTWSFADSLDTSVGSVGDKTKVEMIFTPNDIDNYNIVTGIMVEVTVGCAPLKPSVNDSIISGISNAYKVGDTISFSVISAGMDNNSPLAGDHRCVSLSWECNTNGIFTDGNYSTSFVSNKAGDYTLIVKFTEQEYNGTAWVDVNNTSEKATLIAVKEIPVEEKKSNKPLH